MNCLGTVRGLANLLPPHFPSGDLVLAFRGFGGGGVAFRIHFTRDDLLRVSLAQEPEPLLETVASLRILQQRRPGALFEPWQRWARRRVPRSVHRLRSLVPPHGACPDFLTSTGSTDLDVSLDALLHTPKPRLRADLEAFTCFAGNPLPAWADGLSHGDPRDLEAVGRSVREWHQAALAPIQQHLHAHVEAARSSATRFLLTGGLESMLSGLHPTMRWTAPVLELACPDHDMDIHLEGRGVRLIPSLFCGSEPAINLDPGLSPVVIYPVPHETIWSPEHDPTVLTATLANARGTPSAVPPRIRQRALMPQIHAFIQDNLGDANLAPDAIAAAHHVSLRYLHKLFHQDGHTVAGWVRERRLEQCRRDLADPRLAARPIHAIAAWWGFTSPAHFSQAFRHAYGLSPRQYRQQCATVHAD